MESVRFAGWCLNCGKQLREYYQNIGSTKYPHYKWVEEDHGFAECIRFLKEQIDDLKESQGEYGDKL